ncbi:hypothetical protein Anapl_09387 [Anas platyrhynchos]|uniref:Uncharacterized protein n=1 Tax=Anas platyrhynchos TaxID=8839 RepID=R0LXQ4_ANAPL|nr:hypothetical protein Anapl_09387 [Anas platyrhynchos]
MLNTETITALTSSDVNSASYWRIFAFTEEGQVITWELQQRTNSSSAKPAEDLCGDAFDMVVKPHLASVFPEGSAGLHQTAGHDGSRSSLYIQQVTGSADGKDKRRGNGEKEGFVRCWETPWHPVRELCKTVSIRNYFSAIGVEEGKWRTKENTVSFSPERCYAAGYIADSAVRFSARGDTGTSPDGDAFSKQSDPSCSAHTHCSSRVRSTEGWEESSAVQLEGVGLLVIFKTTWRSLYLARANDTLGPSCCFAEAHGCSSGEICGIVCPRGRRKHMNAPCLPFRHTQVLANLNKTAAKLLLPNQYTNIQAYGNLENLSADSRSLHQAHNLNYCLARKASGAYVLVNTLSTPPSKAHLFRKRSTWEEWSYSEQRLHQPSVTLILVENAARLQASYRRCCPRYTAAGFSTLSNTAAVRLVRLSCKHREMGNMEDHTLSLLLHALLLIKDCCLEGLLFAEEPCKQQADVMLSVAVAATGSQPVKVF